VAIIVLTEDYYIVDVHVPISPICLLSFEIFLGRFLTTTEVENAVFGVKYFYIYISWNPKIKLRVVKFFSVPRLFKIELFLEQGSYRDL